MADPKKGKFSTSPKEDFDPLKEDRPTVHDTPATSQSSDHDADLSSDDELVRYDTAPNSLEGMLEDICDREADDLPFSPPTASRLVRREKIRHSSGSRKQRKMSFDKNTRPKTLVGYIKERYSESNALYSGLAHVDSDADLEREGTRESKDKRKKEREDKNKTKARQHEIYDKRISHHEMSTISENIASNTAPMGISTPVVPITLEGSGRFPSFGLCQAIKVLPVSPVAPEKVERRQTITSRFDCPSERLTFYKTFQALINMGSHGKKNKEDQTRLLAQRQKSSDERLYFNCVWIGLQAWLNSLKVTEQESLMMLEKEQIPYVMNEVMEFKVQFQQLNNSDDLGIPGQDHNRDSSCSVDTCVTDISQTYHTTYLTAEMIEQQQQAVLQVQKLLEKLDRCEQLFPSSKQFAEMYPMFKDPAFVRRTESLYLWLNTTKDLCHKLNVLGQMFDISKVQGLNWPNVDFGSGDTASAISKSNPRTSIPEIVDQSESGNDMNSGDNDDENDVYQDASSSNNLSSATQNEAGKKVTFQFLTGQPRSPSSPLLSPKRDRSPIYGSPPNASTPLRGHYSSSVSLSRASSESSLDDICRTSVYRTYVEKGLKKVGLNKMLIRLRDILYRSLRRARQSLEQPHLAAESMVKSPSDDYYHHQPLAPTLDLLDKSRSKPMESHTPQELQAWREEFLDIGLPSYRPTYIFLLQVLLQVIHEAMRIRLEQLQNPIGEPSFLSIRQLIIECKDVLAKAVLVKRDYQCMVQAVLDDKEAMAENSPLDLEDFDEDMSSMFKMYFQYLQNWLYHLQNLPEASRTLKNPLEEEWSFTKKICPHIIGGEAEAGKRFSTMAVSLLDSISDFLESGIDDCLKYLFDWTMHDVSTSEEGEGDSDEDHDTSARRIKSATGFRRSSQKTCRLFKNLFHEARERASKALGFAKLLRKDLEIAADFNVAVTTEQLLQRLKDTDHINVMAQMSAGYLMFIPARIQEQRRHIIQLLNVTCGREDVSGSADDTSRDDGYLLMVRCGGGIDASLECPLWDGPSLQVEPTAETAIALSHIQVESLLLVVIHSSHLGVRRKEFESLMGPTVELVNEQTSCHQIIADSLVELKESAIALREKVATVIRQVEEHWHFDKDMDEGERKHVLKLYRETMLQAYNFGFEYMKEVTRLVSGEARSRLGRGLMLFAKDWMKFVSEKCERGRGMRPRWANQGLDFLLIACEPKVLATLTEQEYQELQEGLNEFITHLIGNADRPSQFGGPLPMPRHGGHESRNYVRYLSCPASHADGRIPRSQSTRSMQDPTSPQSAPAQAFSSSSSRSPDGMKKRSSESNVEVDIHDGDDGGLVMEVRNKHRASDSGLCESHNLFSYKPHTRITNAINKLESERQHELLDKRVIGRVTKHRGVSYHVNTKKVQFHWQKGNKIGEGQFGKVYSAVNMITGELMAMKEMKFGSMDMQQYFRDIIDELKIFEGINHPNLVKYFGVEVHRTEMLSFMEYCDRGTIDDVSRVGLSEDLIRIYTKQLLKAVQVLHENKIVHRDIKGANIFLTSSGKLKLGDFGCSVKLKNHTTMAGEVNNLVGTTAYMAPEVITRSDKEGHGRAADIWSVGCVVIEMTSGKRPWHELDSKFQIMFKLGMGETPAIPDTLQDEGKDFLRHCLEHDPEKRWNATQLLDHPFAKIYDPDDAEDANTSQV